MLSTYYYIISHLHTTHQKCYFLKMWLPEGWLPAFQKIAYY